MSKGKTTQNNKTVAKKTNLAPVSIPQIESLLEEKEWLLKQIKKKRTELKNFVEQMRTIAREIFIKADPFYQEIYALDREIHELFKEIFTTRKMGYKTRKDIENVYRHLQLMGLISPSEKTEKEEYIDLDDLFGEEEETANNTQEQTAETSENQRSNSKEMRQIFLSLAAKFHPDKVTDPETQMRHTEIMKEINRAYKDNDLAKLMEIASKEVSEAELNLENEAELDRKYRLLIKENQLLHQQYEYLKKELSLAKNTPEGELVKDYRKGKKYGCDLIDEMVEMVEYELANIESLKNFVQDFRDKKITVKEFLRGPQQGINLTNEQIEDIMDQIIKKMDF